MPYAIGANRSTRGRFLKGGLWFLFLASGISLAGLMLSGCLGGGEPYRTQCQKVMAKDPRPFWLKQGYTTHGDDGSCGSVESHLVFNRERYFSTKPIPGSVVSYVSWQGVPRLEKMDSIETIPGLTWVYWRARRFESGFFTPQPVRVGGVKYWMVFSAFPALSGKEHCYYGKKNPKVAEYCYYPLAKSGKYIYTLEIYSTDPTGKQEEEKTILPEYMWNLGEGGPAKWQPYQKVIYPLKGHFFRQPSITTNPDGSMKTLAMNPWRMPPGLAVVSKDVVHSLPVLRLAVGS